MLTRERVLEQVKAGRKGRDNCEILDGRDYCRLSIFFPASDWGVFGFALKGGAMAPTPANWTEENIKMQLEKDLAFALEKAHCQRGISSALMYEVIKMWLWILESPLQNFDDYEPYGLPLYQAVEKELNLARIEKDLTRIKGDNWSHVK